VDLESEIHAINNKLNAMSGDISLIQQRDEFDAREKENLTNVVKELAISVNRLNLTMGKKDGVHEGQITVMVWVAAAVGTIAMVWLIWITNSTVSNNNDVANLKEKCANHEVIK